jgi:dCTP deaminase
VILSDRSIREAIESGRLGIDPFDPALIQPSSIDVRLDQKFLVFRNTKRAYIDVKQPAEDLMELIEVEPDEPMFLHPHEFVLGSTLERVRIPNDLVGRLEGRSSLGRLGIVIHSTAGFLDPSFEGHVTLEISNLANLPIALYPRMRIGQISFVEMTTPAERPYGPARGSKYSGQQLPTASRLYLDFLKQ